MTETTIPRKGLYLVKRTSSSRGKPCKGAFEITRKIVDRRTVDDPKKIPANKGTNGDWYEMGTNHRVENGMICRDMGQTTEWAIEIDDVMEFVDKINCECIFSRLADGFAQIEIYDEFRE